jgi:hypothetical protein
MSTTECRFIPHDEAERYRRLGWDVSPLPYPHGYYSMLATRPVERDDSDWEVMHCGAGGLE